MAKVKPLEIIKGLCGKVCEHSDMYFRTNRQTGEVFTGKVCYPSEDEPSVEQVAVRGRFRKVSTAIRARIAALESDAKAALVAAYKAQHKIGSLFGYAFRKWNDEYDANGDLKQG